MANKNKNEKNDKNNNNKSNQNNSQKQNQLCILNKSIYSIMLHLVEINNFIKILNYSNTNLS